MDIITSRPIYIFDSSHNSKEQLYQPFAWGDTFLREVNDKKEAIILHIWTMEKTVVLGMVDRRLPYCDDAIKEVRTHGYRAVVRNVGGLAVVSDQGIVNLSFIIPVDSVHKLSIKQAYEWLTHFIQKMFEKYTKKIEHYEIAQSYCPGEYDLSIDGKKFAGIAQRRFKDGVMISIYLSVCGNQQKRGQLVKRFYEKGLKGERTNFSFPTIDPNCMANLSDLLGVRLDVPAIKTLLMDTLTSLNATYSPLNITQALQENYDKFYGKMIERNRKA